MDLFLQLLANGLINGSHYALLALGFGLIFSTTNILHFAYGPLYAVAAYVGWALAALLGLPLWLAGLGAIACTGALGGATYLVLYRPFEARGAPLFVILIVSLGLFIVLENVIGLVAGTDTKVISDLQYGIFFVGNVFFTELQVYQVIALAVIGALIWGFLRFTSYGKAILAMTDNAEMARVIGIDTVRVGILVFVLGSAISAVPGMLILLKEGAAPAMGFQAVFLAFLAVVIGGVGSMRGAVLGGFLLGIVESTGMLAIPTEWQSTISFVVLFLVLVFRPTGLFRGT
jgi:branched-chain amino acid transport system permease protein